MDMEKVFDKVPKDRIWNGFRKMLIRATQSLYKGTRNVIVVKNMMSTVFTRKQGVIQGTV